MSSVQVETVFSEDAAGTLILGVERPMPCASSLSRYIIIKLAALQKPADVTREFAELSGAGFADGFIMTSVTVEGWVEILSMVVHGTPDHYRAEVVNL